MILRNIFFSLLNIHANKRNLDNILSDENEDLYYTVSSLIWKKIHYIKILFIFVFKIQKW